jgi:hypothetical protein
MKCPNCGTDNPDNYVFCGRCGAVALAMGAVNREKVEQIKARIRETVNTRKATDRIIDPMWLALCIVLSVIATVVFIATTVSLIPYFSIDSTSVIIGYAFLCVLTAVISFIFAFIAYQLVKRQNDHFKREWDLRANILNLFKALAGTPEREALLFRDIGPMLAAHKQAEPIREPWFWALITGFPGISIAIILLLTSPIFFGGITSFDPSAMSYYLLVASVFIVFIVIAAICGLLELYMQYFLTKTMFEHDRRWLVFSYGASNVLSKFGIQPDWNYVPFAMPDREPIIYVVLCFFVPPFWIYWFYILITDPNNHFRSQWKYEKWLAKSLDSLRY